MVSPASFLIALVAFLFTCTSGAVEATPITLSSRKLQGRCATQAWQQCGGRGKPDGENQKKNGPWRCCPSGYKCTKVNYWYWHCAQKNTRQGKGNTPKVTPTSTPAATRTPGPSPKSNDNRRVSTSSSSSGPIPFTDDCTQIRQNLAQTSGWCYRNGQAVPMVSGTVPKEDIYLGRQTMYKGPVMKQLGYCGKILEGAPDAAAIAISTKFLAQGEWQFATDAQCGRCACLKILGSDQHFNPQPPAGYEAYVGKVFKGQVRDMCPECASYSVDVLADQPYSRAWPDQGGDNPFASAADARATVEPVMDIQMAITVGVWNIHWGFVDCAQSCDASFFT